MRGGRRIAALGAALIALALPCAALAAFPGSDPAESPRANTPNDPGFDRCEGDDPDTPAGDCDSYFEEQFGSFGFSPDSAQAAPGLDGPTVRQLRAARRAGPERQPRRRRSRRARRSPGSEPTPPGSTRPAIPAVSVAILDTGIRWQDAELVDKVRLNKGELPLPQHANGVDLRELRLQRRRRLQRQRLRRRPARRRTSAGDDTSDTGRTPTRSSTPPT